MTASRRVQAAAIATAALATILVAAIGGTLTDLGPWYQALKEPDWKPPDAAFGPIWTVVFSCAAAAGLLFWRAETRAARRQWVLGLFALNGFFNILWSVMFFQIRRPDLALVEIAALEGSVLALMLLLAPVSRRASALMAPYLLWVGIAAKLNYDVVVLNGPFS